MIQLNDEQYWLYAAVDSETNELLHTKLEPTTNKVIAHSFFAELREQHDVEDAVFLINGSHSLKDACSRHGIDFRYAKHGDRNSIERVFREVQRRTSFEPLKTDFFVAFSQYIHLCCVFLRDSPSNARVISEGLLKGSGRYPRQSTIWMAYIRIPGLSSASDTLSPVQDSVAVQ